MFLSLAGSVLDFVNSSIDAIGSRKGRQQKVCSVRVQTGVLLQLTRGGMPRSCSHYVCFKMALSGPRFFSCLHCRIFESMCCLD